MGLILVLLDCEIRCENSVKLSSVVSRRFPSALGTASRCLMRGGGGWLVSVHLCVATVLQSSHPLANETVALCHLQLWEC